MRTAQKGDRVTVHYIGTLDNGRIFDQRDADAPLEIVLGAGDVFPSLEEQVIGMAVGEVKNITLEPGQAFGERRQENILKVERSMFPEDRALQVGQKLNLEFKSGEALTMRVIEVDASGVTLDGNHVLAGQTLTFALKLAAIA